MIVCSECGYYHDEPCDNCKAVHGVSIIGELFLCEDCWSKMC